MKSVFSIIKNIVAVMAIIVIVYIALKYAPFLREQEWNPVNHSPNPMSQNNQGAPIENTQQANLNGKHYSLKDNDLIQNVPASQTKNVFNMINKQEFMAVSGLDRMGYNDKYLIGQRGDEFIIYKFGNEDIRVYNTEFEMQQDLNKLGQQIELKPVNAFQ